MEKKVLVSGNFDLLTKEVISLLKKAKNYGDVHVALNSDKSIINTTKYNPVNSEYDRLLVLKELKDVKEAFIMDIENEEDLKDKLKKIKPDIYISDNILNTAKEEEICKLLNIQYILEKDSRINLSTAELIGKIKIPYRIDLAGGWLDQPFVSKYYPGPVLTISIESNHEFNLRSGMATSTRNKAIRIWKNNIPEGHEENAKLLFSYDNPPGTKEFSGSQDAIGIIMPGMNYLYYEGGYWPKKITTINDENTLNWLESKIYLIPLKPRESNFEVLKEVNINKENVKKLSEATENCFKKILLRDIQGFGENFTKSFEAQIAIFPRMVNQEILNEVKKYKNIVKGWKVSGAGGGGYLILISDKPIETKDAIKIKIRRK